MLTDISAYYPVGFIAKTTGPSGELVIRFEVAEGNIQLVGNTQHGNSGFAGDGHSPQRIHHLLFYEAVKFIDMLWRYGSS